MKHDTMARQLRLFIAFCLLLAIASCGGKEGDTTVTGNDSSQVDDGVLSESTQEKYDYVISNIPIPFEILDRLFKSGVTFQKDYTNPVNNISKYLQNNSKALNLGIYGADLTYTICFEQFNELNPYLKSAKKLADELGIPLAFNKETLDKYQDYKTNKDSLRNAVYSSYSQVDQTLRSNERISLAALVVTGGWIEGLHITSKTAADTSLKPEVRKELFRIIRKQQFHLNNIIGLLNEFKKDPYFSQMITDLEDIDKAYQATKKKNEVSEEEAAIIGAKVEAIRAKIVEGS
jgi:hypothetical protein